MTNTWGRERGSGGKGRSRATEGVSTEKLTSDINIVKHKRDKKNPKPYNYKLGLCLNSWVAAYVCCNQCGP